ncbi:PadR family transcriptional regulator [Blastococcus haudaquaticus]|uniref:PadR family transcriptional regulator, regulatory protein PadR n=1 Tax=Blastococcus haudaquaticus TaxID=1938745 RepID=A0A286H672_9ACTN|nr:PadR family transcriptional regulator [Blastococcus haudaquaticus]SOE02764.1 PadR family transcriptional regulator, regulatory protein PadR [Blastococcus haudaquaticus]
MADDRRAQWLRGVLDLCVLAELQRGESYGYGVARALEDLGLGPVPGGTLYPVLGRLERAELIRSRWVDSASGPPRKYYGVTAAGTDLLRREAGEWALFAARVGTALGAGVTPVRETR